MAASERILYQPYTLGRRGNLTPGKPVPCRNADEAVRRAERAIAGGLIVGAQVVRVVVDEEAGDYGEPLSCQSAPYPTRSSHESADGRCGSAGDTARHMQTSRLIQRAWTSAGP